MSILAKSCPTPWCRGSTRQNRYYYFTFFCKPVSPVGTGQDKHKRRMARKSWPCGAFRNFTPVVWISGGGGATRTPDLLNPNQMRYHLRCNRLLSFLSGRVYSPNPWKLQSDILCPLGRFPVLLRVSFKPLLACSLQALLLFFGDWCEIESFMLKDVLSGSGLGNKRFCHRERIRKWAELTKNNAEQKLSHS